MRGGGRRCVRSIAVGCGNDGDTVEAVDVAKCGLERAYLRWVQIGRLRQHDCCGGGAIDFSKRQARAGSNVMVFQLGVDDPLKLCLVGGGTNFLEHWSISVLVTGFATLQTVACRIYVHIYHGSLYGTGTNITVSPDGVAARRVGMPAALNTKEERERMPWTDKPGGSGSGNNGGGRGPWGQQTPPSNGSNGSGNNGPADIEELFRSGRERFRRGGRGGNGGSGGQTGEFKMPPAPVLFIGAAVIGLIYLASGFYSIDPGARGVVTTFGKYSGVTGPGLNWHVPWPVQNAEIVSVDEDRDVSIQRTQSGRTSMLTSDLNIVDVEMTVNYRVAQDGTLEPGEMPSAAKFIFNIEGHENLVRAAAESALRQVVGANDFEPVISRGRSIVPRESQEILQEVLDSYDSGIQVIRVNFGQADPPQEVIPAQNDVIDARSEAERLVNEANRYKNSTVPRAAGQARQIELTAEAYAQRVVRESNGQARRFKDIYAEYLRAPEVTRRRMYLETMEGVLGEMNKVVIDESAGAGTLPYLNLNELTRRTGSSSTNQGGQ